jgi:hypothetical protein
MATSRASSSPVETDPELCRQLDAAHGTGRSVEAVLMLRDATEPAFRSETARQQARSAVERVEREIGVAPAAVNVLANLGMVIVAAEEPFVRKLLDQPEFASAAANGHDNGAVEQR